MTRTRKLTLVGASIAALAVAGGGVAIAATKAWSPREERKAVLDDVAKELGVTPAELSDAFKQALKNRVDDALADGRITEAQADALKKRIDASDYPLPFGFFKFGLGPPLEPFDHGPFGFLGPFAKLDAAASYLGLRQRDLRSRLSDGKTLAEIAKDEGKSVDGLVDALVTAAEKQIDGAVDDGKLTESQGEKLKSGLRERMTRLVSSDFLHSRRFEPPGFRFRHDGFLPDKPRFHRNFWFPRGSSA
jgi:polyhydroxyalkanoate synthesis regulator phasin